MALPSIPVGLQIATSIGLPIAQGIFASRDQDRYAKKFGKQQAYNNFIAALSRGRINPENTVTPRAGMGSKILGGLSKGLGAYNTLQAASQQADALRGQIENRNLTNEQLRQQNEMRAGMAKHFMGQQLEDQQAAERAQSFADRTQPAALKPLIPADDPLRARPPQQRTLGVTQPDFAPSFGGELAGGMDEANRLRTTPQTPFEAMGFALQSADIAKLAASKQQVAFNKYIEFAKLRLDYFKASRENMESLMDDLTPAIENYAAENPITPWETVAGQFTEGLDERGIARVQSVYEGAQREWLKGLDEDSIAFFKMMGSQFNQDQHIKKSGDLKFGMSSLITGFNADDSAGDLMMINAMVRLMDPGVSVRPAEFDTIEDAQPWLEKQKLILSGEKWMQGRKLSAPVRHRMMQIGQQNYGANINLVNDGLKKAHDFSMQFGLFGNNDFMKGKLTTFIDRYRLSPLSAFPAFKIDPNLVKKVVEGVSLAPGSGFLQAHTTAESTGVR